MVAIGYYAIGSISIATYSRNCVWWQTIRSRRNVRIQPCVSGRFKSHKFIDGAVYKLLWRIAPVNDVALPNSFNLMGRTYWYGTASQLLYCGSANIMSIFEIQLVFAIRIINEAAARRAAIHIANITQWRI